MNDIYEDENGRRFIESSKARYYAIEASGSSRSKKDPKWRKLVPDKTVSERLYSAVDALRWLADAKGVQIPTGVLDGMQKMASEAANIELRTQVVDALATELAVALRKVHLQTSSETDEELCTRLAGQLVEDENSRVTIELRTPARRSV